MQIRPALSRCALACWLALLISFTPRSGAADAASAPGLLGGKPVAKDAPKAEDRAAGRKKKGKDVPGAEIFDTLQVLPIRIVLTSTNYKSLQREPRKYVRADFYEGTNVWKDVGIHIKGAAGSSRGIDDKPALTVAFAQFVTGQRFHGLRKIHLNNSVQDASYLTENLCGELFRKAGVPAARAGYATVEINGRKKGFYVVKEGFTKEMLGLYFKNTKGNLYDGGFLRDVHEQLERDLGEDTDVKDWSDLKDLNKAAQEKDVVKRWEELNKVLDMDRFLSFAAVEVMAWDWDGYILNRNNYRVYHDQDQNKMVFIPHGMDQMFWEPQRSILPVDKIDASIVGRAVWRTPAGKQLYRQRFGEIFTNHFQIAYLTNRVNELGALVRAELVKLEGTNGGKNYDEQLKRMLSLITQRHKSLAVQLSQPEPEVLKFQEGVARLPHWEPPAGANERGYFLRDKAEVDGRQALRIVTIEDSGGSWRSRLLLNAGEYRFEIETKTLGVLAASNFEKGEGAGIRHSGIKKPRQNKLVGNSDWQKLSYDFKVEMDGMDITLICELIAEEGSAWFDIGSARLLKLK